MSNLPTVVDWDAELRGASMLVKSRLTPKDIATPEAAMFVILAGRDMGLSPVQSLRSIRIIQGKLELSADIQLGKFHERGGRSQWIQLTDESVKLKLMAPWSIEPHVSTFTIQDAKRAGLLSNPTWQKYPKAMLRSRAITQGLKDIGFILGSGVYAPGEISGNAVTIDESTGEVLPVEPTTQTVVEAVESVNIGRDLESQAYAELDDDTREQTNTTAMLIRDALSKNMTTEAFNCYMKIPSTEEKAAVKALLTKDEKKQIRTYYDQYCKDQIKTGVPQDKPALGAPVSIADVREHIQNRDWDLAMDVASSLPDEMERVEAVHEVKKAHKHAKETA